MTTTLRYLQKVNLASSARSMLKYEVVARKRHLSEVHNYALLAESDQPKPPSNVGQHYQTAASASGPSSLRSSSAASPRRDTNTPQAEPLQATLGLPNETSSVQYWIADALAVPRGASLRQGSGINCAEDEEEAGESRRPDGDADI